MTYNSRLAELGKWADTQPGGEALHDALFRAYFVEARDISQPAVLLEIAERVGLPVDKAREVLEQRTFKAAIDADWALPAATASPASRRSSPAATVSGAALRSPRRARPPVPAPEAKASRGVIGAHDVTWQGRAMGGRGNPFPPPITAPWEWSPAAAVSNRPAASWFQGPSHGPAPPRHPRVQNC
jgi:hypothetical protein